MFLTVKIAMTEGDKAPAELQLASEEIFQLITEAIATLQRDNWQDRQMTTGEQVAAGLAVQFVLERLQKKALRVT